MKVLLTHTPDFRRQYYGERALKGLQALAEDPSLLSERSAELESAVLLLLQRLSPTERAVFVQNVVDNQWMDLAEYSLGAVGSTVPRER